MGRNFNEIKPDRKMGVRRLQRLKGNKKLDNFPLDKCNKIVTLVTELLHNESIYAI